MKNLLLILLIVLASPLRAAPGSSPQLLEIPVPESPTVALRVVIEIGSVDDPKSKLGLCNLTMQAAADGGTPGLTKTEVADLLYPMAASIDVYVDRETTVFSGSVRAEDLAAFYPIFWDLIFHPRFETGDLERLRESTLSSLRNDLKGTDDEWLGKEVLQSQIFKQTAWEHPSLGTESGLQSIRPDDVRAFHRRMMVAPFVHVGIAGSYDKAFAERVRKDLERLPTEPVPARARILEPVAAFGIEILLVDKPVRSTAISIGFPHSVRRGDPDYWPLFLAVTAFGEHRTFLGRLQREMRSIRGLNYGDYAYLGHFVPDGWGRFGRFNIWRAVPYFSIWIRPVQPENALFALRQGVWELRHLVQEGLTQQEFETTREHVRNVSQLWRQTLQRRLGMAMDDAQSGGGDTLAELTKALDAMTLDEVNGALEKRLNPRNLRAVLVCANADSIQGVFLRRRPTPIVYTDGEPPVDVLEKDAEIARMMLDPMQVKIVRASALYK